jgi:threonine dehydrogenase-like Zn-dependent dehydrogenase
MRVDKVADPELEKPDDLLLRDQAPVQKYIDELIELVANGKVKLNDIISHRLSIDQAPYAYQIFRTRKIIALR